MFCLVGVQDHLSLLEMFFQGGEKANGSEVALGRLLGEEFCQQDVLSGKASAVPTAVAGGLRGPLRGPITLGGVLVGFERLKPTQNRLSAKGFSGLRFRLTPRGKKNGGELKSGNPSLEHAYCYARVTSHRHASFVQTVALF